MYYFTSKQHAKQRPHFPSCVQLTCYFFKRKRWWNASFFFFFLLEKKRLQNFGKNVNQQLHLYKNTFNIFSVCHQGRTADPEDFFHRGKNLILESVLRNVFCPYISVVSPASGLMWPLSSVFGLSFTKLPTAPGHLAPIKSFSPHGPEVPVLHLLLLLLLFSSWES